MPEDVKKVPYSYTYHNYVNLKTDIPFTKFVWVFEGKITAFKHLELQ